MMERTDFIQLAANIIEGLGVSVILLGVPMAILLSLMNPERKGRLCLLFRRSFGRHLLLGLEFLIGADIIRTVAVRPTLEQALSLGLVVLIRTFLSFTLEVELRGRWPWQRDFEQTDEKSSTPIS